jgi:pimeloyl-ACP methyl ester carboxylesterase
LQLTDDQQERVIIDSLKGGAVAKQAWPNQAMREDIRPDVRRINVRPSCCRGERDQVDPASTLRTELLPHISDSELQTLPRVGQLAMREDPERWRKEPSGLSGSFQKNRSI